MATNRSVRGRIARPRRIYYGRRAIERSYTVYKVKINSIRCLGSGDNQRSLQLGPSVASNVIDAFHGFHMNCLEKVISFKIVVVIAFRS